MDEAALEQEEIDRLRAAAWTWLTTTRLRPVGAGAEDGAPGAAAEEDEEEDAVDLLLDRDAHGPASGAMPAQTVEVARKHLKGLLEALVFASDKPMTEGELAKQARAEKKLVKELLAELAGEYQHRGFRLMEVASGWALRTSPLYASFVRDLAAKKPIKMSRAQTETLAIVAYRQPMTRPEVDEVRGVDSGAALKSLLERDLVRILGKRDEPGRPLIYGTTPQFLEFFGLKSLADLPTLREFTELSDESRRIFEREMGEEPPDPSIVQESFAGGEGRVEEAAVPTEAPPAADDEDEDDEDDEDHEDDEDDEDDGDPVPSTDEPSTVEPSTVEPSTDEDEDDDDDDDEDDDDEDEDDEDDEDDDDDDEDDEDDDDDDDDGVPTDEGGEPPPAG